MAIITKKIDDLDQKSPAETVTFAVDGRGYEIDLSDANAEKFRKLVEPYVKAGRVASGRSLASRVAVVLDGADLATVRAWARDHGHQMSDRGRIPDHIVEAYNKAHTTKK